MPTRVAFVWVLPLVLNASAFAQDGIKLESTRSSPEAVTANALVAAPASSRSKVSEHSRPQLSAHDERPQSIATACDAYAASEFDTGRKAVGVPLEKIDPVLALPACESAAQLYSDDGRVTYQLGRVYQKANNLTAATRQYRIAAYQRFALGQFGLGVVYQNGLGVPQDDGQAVAWYRKAAERGLAPAEFYLGVMYFKGQGVSKDSEEAQAWFRHSIAGIRKAAQEGGAQAQFVLGVMYQNALGVPKDLELAVAWYRKAAERGLASAQLYLGDMYQNGQGVRKDVKQAETLYRQAAGWYRKASEQGIAEEQFFLGRMYENGWGVERDLEQAVFWYQKAADQEDTQAQNNLKELLERAEAQQSGLRYAREPQPWISSQQKNVVTGPIDVIARSIQKNEAGLRFLYSKPIGFDNAGLALEATDRNIRNPEGRRRAVATYEIRPHHRLMLKYVRLSWSVHRHAWKKLRWGAAW